MSCRTTRNGVLKEGAERGSYYSVLLHNSESTEEEPPARRPDRMNFNASTNQPNDL